MHISITNRTIFASPWPASGPRRLSGPYGLPARSHSRSLPGPRPGQSTALSSVSALPSPWPAPDWQNRSRSVRPCDLWKAEQTLSNSPPRTNTATGYPPLARPLSTRGSTQCCFRYRGMHKTRGIGQTTQMGRTGTLPLSRSIPARLIGTFGPTGDGSPEKAPDKDPEKRSRNHPVRRGLRNPVQVCGFSACGPKIMIGPGRRHFQALNHGHPNLGQIPQRDEQHGPDGSRIVHVSQPFPRGRPLKCHGTFQGRRRRQGTGVGSGIDQGRTIKAGSGSRAATVLDRRMADR